MHTKFADGTKPWGAIDPPEEALQRDIIALNAGNPVILQLFTFL